MHIGIAGPVSVELLTSRFPGVETFPRTYSFPLIAQLAIALHEKGLRVTVFAASDEISAGKYWSHNGFSLAIVPWRKKFRHFTNFSKEIANVSAAMRNSECNLIHAHWANEFAAAALRSAIPCLVTCHDSPYSIRRHYFGANAAGLYWFMRYRLQIANLKKARYLSAVSSYTAACIKPHLRSDADARVIYNGIRQSMDFNGKTAIAPAADTLPMLVTILQGFEGRKNGKGAIRAFGILKREIPGAKMVMFGDGYGSGGPAEKFAESLKLCQGIEFRGRVAHSQILDFLREGRKILLHPAHEEQCSMAILEGLGMGLCVLGGQDAGGVPEQLDFGGGRNLFNTKDAVSIAKTAARVITNPELADELVSLGQKTVASKFSMEHMVDQYRDFYEHIAAQVHAGRKVSQK